MKRSTTFFLQAALLLIGIVAAFLLLWEPHLEGRNAHADMFAIYFKDPFLAFVYVGSLSFFYALYRAFRLAGDVRKDGGFSPKNVEALRTIKHCAFAMLGFVAVGVLIILAFGDGEDRPGGLFMSLLVAFGASMIAFTAARLSRQVRNALGQPDASKG